MNKQLSKGINVEREHKGTIRFIKSYVQRYGRVPANRKIYSHIASDHIRENPAYYTRFKFGKRKEYLVSK